MDQQTSDRFVNVEMLCAHLQHDVEQMHHVLLALQSDLKVMQQQLERLQTQVSDIGQNDEGIDPLAERPPHY
ncbi:MAG: SlyX family protein [Planctomycetota bacterium]|nr:SlyX family protein [Planctomycetota bacterium]MDA1211621.1 SlyX family protein [Planctomycetota bacterium]